MGSPHEVAVGILLSERITRATFVFFLRAGRLKSCSFSGGRIS